MVRKRSATVGPHDSAITCDYTPLNHLPLPLSVPKPARHSDAGRLYVRIPPMTLNDPIRESLLDSTPDVPLWSATRYLLKDGGRIVSDDSGAVVANRDGDFLAVIGAPHPETITDALTHATDDAEILVQCDFANRFREATGLPGKHANLYTLPTVAPAQGIDLQADVRFLDAPPADLPDADLVEELTEVFEQGVAISAVHVDGQPVAFCYSVCESEAYWEVSIDTLAEHRRKGHAIQTFLHHYHAMKKRKLQPIWGAFDDNLPSVNLAHRLGFKPAHEIWEFTLDTDK